jgi:hypothetical protein
MAGEPESASASGETPLAVPPMPASLSIEIMRHWMVPCSADFGNQKKSQRFFSLRLYGGLGCLSFIGPDCSRVWPAAQRDFGYRVIAKLLVVLDEHKP